MADNNTELSPRERQLANLKEPWKKGQSGNPAGKPVGAVSIKAELQKLLEIVLEGEINPLNDMPEDMPVGRKIALNLVLQAVADNKLDAIKMALEHIDGKPLARNENTGKDGGPLAVVVQSHEDKDLLNKI